jgi:hypothetical protein
VNAVMNLLVLALRCLLVLRVVTFINTDSKYVVFSRYNLTVSHRRHVYNSSHISNITNEMFRYLLPMVPSGKCRLCFSPPYCFIFYKVVSYIKNTYLSNICYRTKF